MSDLIDFLQARLAADEATARAAAFYEDGAEHDVQGPPGTWVLLADQEFFGAGHPGGVIGPRIGHVNSAVQGRHIVRHDPARVLVELQAKREVLRLAARTHDYHESFMNGFASAMEGALRMFAQAYADHPDYREDWRP